MMRYAAIDIETTGISPDTCQVLEIGCVIENEGWSAPVEELPTFRALVRPDGVIRGDAQALAMNHKLLAELASKSGVDAHLSGHLIDLGAFIHDHLGDTSITIAGKNFGSFDLQFLRRNEFWQPNIRHKHRFIDPAMLWWIPRTDAFLPDLMTCMGRAGVSCPLHTAVDDCRAVIECVRAFYR